MKPIVFTPTMPALAVITRFTTAALLLVALAACNSGSGGSGGSTKEATPIPLEPTNLVAKGVSGGIDISWNKAKEATSYTVYYHTASFDSTTDKITGNRVDSTTDITTDNISITGLSNGTKYYLRVAAISADKKTKLSKQVVATTKLLTLQPKAAASINRLAAVDLSWDATTDDVTNYKIYYAKQSLDGLNGGYTNYAPVGKVDTTTGTSVTIGGLDAATTYYFVVAANYKDGEKSAPEVTADSSYIAELAMGGYHGCVRLNTGGIKCWGRNSYGQLGVDDTTDRYTATSVDLLAKQLSVGVNHSCAINLSDRLYCWGSNEQLRLGLSGGDISIPTEVKQANKLDTVSLVSAGERTTCALAGGENYCWGDQDFGGLGNGVDSDDPTKDAQVIKDITPDVRQFAVGSNSGCAIDASDDLWCWGNSNKGQVGDGKDTNRASPVKPKLQGSSFATMVAGKYRHYCVVDDANKIQCWGWNNSGQLGINGTSEVNNIPQYVLTSDSTSDHLSNVSKVATGYSHSCAIIKDGSADSSVRCWGESYGGIIGTSIDDEDDRLIAGTTDIPGINNAVDIAAGYSFTCVLLADRARVECWGRNGYGQLGIGDTDGDSSTPVAVTGL